MRCGTHLPGAWLTATWTPQAVQPSFPRNRRLQVNINPAYRAGELTYALNQAGVSALVLARGLRGSREFIDIVDSVAAKTQLEHRVLLADEAPEGESLGLCGAVACFAVWRAVLGCTDTAEAPVLLADEAPECYVAVAYCAVLCCAVLCCAVLPFALLPAGLQVHPAVHYIRLSGFTSSRKLLRWHHSSNLFAHIHALQAT